MSQRARPRRPRRGAPGEHLLRARARREGGSFGAGTGAPAPGGGGPLTASDRGPGTRGAGAPAAGGMAGRRVNVNVGVLGHIDSGKTALARALSTTASTAAFDKQPQSRERGITLDLGFSCFAVPLPGAAEPGGALLQVTLVDCPGHASLIRTIIGGERPAAGGLARGRAGLPAPPPSDPGARLAHAHGGGAARRGPCPPVLAASVRSGGWSWVFEAPVVHRCKRHPTVSRPVSLFLFFVVNRAFPLSDISSAL